MLDTKNRLDTRNVLDTVELAPSEFFSDGKPVTSERTQWRLETLSPVHIGSGEKIERGLEIGQEGTNLVIAPTLWLQEQIAQKASLPELEQLAEGRFDLLSFLRRWNLLNDRALMRLPAPREWRDLARHMRVGGTCGAPLIPGSSIKGALVSAILWWLSTEGPPDARQFSATARFHLMNGIMAWKPGEKDTAQALEKAFLGSELRNKVTRLLMVPDIVIDANRIQLNARGGGREDGVNRSTERLSYSQVLKAVESKILSPSMGGDVLWKQGGKDNATEDAAAALSLVHEAIQTGVIIEGLSLRLHQVLLNQWRVRELDPRSRQQWELMAETLHDLPTILNAYAAHRLKQEKAYVSHLVGRAVPASPATERKRMAEQVRREVAAMREGRSVSTTRGSTGRMTPIRLERVLERLQALEQQNAELNGRGGLLQLGWGGGRARYLPGPISGEPYGELRRQLFYPHGHDKRTSYVWGRKDIEPFPKTRRYIFENGQPSDVWGWVKWEKM